jgi:hypothetical protein
MKYRDDQTSRRDNLGFTSEALSSFYFLIKDYNFKCVKANTTFVRYESKFLFVIIYHGRKSYELEVEIGKLEESQNTPENGYTIGEVMELFDVRKDLKFTFFQASCKSQVQVLVRKLADYVRSYAKPILDGDYGIFEKLQNLRQMKSEAYIREMNLRNIREMADIAWRQKDYAKYVDLYNSVKDNLTSIEVKKLHYALKKIQAD